MARRFYGLIGAISGNEYEIVADDIMNNGVYDIYLRTGVNQYHKIGGVNRLEASTILDFARLRIEDFDREISN